MKKILWLIPIVMLGIAILPLPYSYYMLLRLVVCASAVYFAIQFLKSGNQSLLFTFGFFAILYNPIFPIYLYSKALWIVINIGTAFIYFFNKDKMLDEIET